MSYVSFSCRLASIAVFLGAIANADVFYTDQSTFEANASGLTSVDFTGAVGNNEYKRVNYPPSAQPLAWTYENLTFSDTTGNLALIGPEYLNHYSGVSQAVLNEQLDPGDLTVALPSAVTAVGLKIGGNFGSGKMSITLSDGSTTTFSVPATAFGDIGFIGFTADSAISSFTLADTLNSNAYYFETPLVEYGTSANITATPEPRYYAVLLCGLLGLAGARWRYRTR